MAVNLCVVAYFDLWFGRRVSLCTDWERTDDSCAKAAVFGTKLTASRFFVKFVFTFICFEIRAMFFKVFERSLF